MAKHIPDRQCVGCRELKPKRELVRIVRDQEGKVELDDTGKKAGRGAYICPSLECLQKARQNRGLERSFKATVSPQIYDEIARLLTANAGVGEAM